MLIFFVIWTVIVSGIEWIIKRFFKFNFMLYVPIIIIIFVLIHLLEIWNTRPSEGMAHSILTFGIMSMVSIGIIKVLSWIRNILLRI